MTVAITPQLDGYHLLEEVDANHFGRRYLADYDNGKQALVQTIDPVISNGENFLVRFELLRNLLPAIQHPNLVKILSLGFTHNIFYIAKVLPASTLHNLKTLSSFDLRDTPSQSLALEQVLTGIAEGLAALEEVKDSFHQEGIIHDALTPNHIYLTEQKALVGGSAKLSPQIDLYSERFLYYGDDTLATSRYHFYNGHIGDSEQYLPPTARQGSSPAGWWHQYSFATIAYKLITHRTPKGRLPPLTNLAPSHAATWETLLEQCFSSAYGKGFNSMREVVDKIREITRKEETLTPLVRRIRREEPPEGMTFVALEEKVTLGNNQGPLQEQPLFKARLKPFFIDKTAVTNAQFEEFMPTRLRSSYSRDDNSPATLIPWNLAIAYCNWRSKKEGLPKGTYRLPTEYEWETACRGATGEQYPWGKEFDQRYCHSGANKEAGAICVTDRPPSRFGIYQLIGNVWEWTCSSFQPHPLSTDTKTQYNSKLKVAKGGCWLTAEEECRASLRAAFHPEEPRANIGFRCVRQIDP